MATTMSRLGRRAAAPALVAPCGDSSGSGGAAPDKGTRDRTARWEEASAAAAAAAAALRQRELEEGAAEALAGGLLGAVLEVAPANGGSRVSDKLRASSTPARGRAQKRHLDEDMTMARQSPARRSARPSRSSASAPAWLSPNSRTATSGSSGGAPSPSINHHAASDAAAHDREMEYEAKEAEDGGGRGRSRLVWTPELHERFMNAVNHLGVKHAVPKTILQLMNVEGLTRENVASHLQKYRLYLKRLAGVPLNAPISAEALQRVQEVQLQAVALQQNAPQWPPPQYAPRPPLRLDEHQRDAAAHDPALAQIASLSQAGGSSAGTSVGATAVQLSVRELDLRGSLSAVQRMRSASCSEAESQRSAPTDTASSDGGSGALDAAVKGPRLSVNEYAAWMGTYPGMDFRLPSSQELGFRPVRAGTGGSAIVAGFGSPLPSPAVSPTAAAAAGSPTSQGPAAVAAAVSGTAPGLPAPPLWQPIGQIAGVPILGGTAALQLSSPADTTAHKPGKIGSGIDGDLPRAVGEAGAGGGQPMGRLAASAGEPPEAAGPSSLSAVATPFQATAVKEEDRAADCGSSGTAAGKRHAAPTPARAQGAAGRGSLRSHPLDLQDGSPANDGLRLMPHGETRRGRNPQRSAAVKEGRESAVRNAETAAAARATAEAAEIAAIAESEVLSGIR